MQDKELKRLEARFDGGARSDQQTVARRRLPEVRNFREELADLGEALRQQWRKVVEWWTSLKPEGEPFVDQEAVRTRQFHRVVGWIAFLGEAALAAFLAQSWLVAPWYVAVPIGLVVTIILTVVSKVLWRLGFDQTNPSAPYEARERVLLTLGILIVALVALFTLFRFVTVPDWLVLSQVGALGVLLPVFAAGAFVLAALVDGPNNLARRFLATRQFSRRIDTLIGKMEAVLQEEVGPTEPVEAEPAKAEETRVAEDDRGGGDGRPAHEEESKKHAIRVAVLIGLLLLPLSVVGAEAQVLQLWADVSGSVDAAEARRVLSLFSSLAFEAEGTERVEVFPFAEAVDSLRAPQFVVEAPAEPELENCAPPNEAARLLRTAHERYVKACNKEREVALAPYFATQRKTRERLTAALGGINIDGHAPRTCLLQVVQRCLAEPSGTTCVIVTDGLHQGCPRPRKLFPDSKNSRVIVILVPSDGDGVSAVDFMAEREEALKRFSPVTVVPSFRAEHDLRRLLTQ